MFVRSIARGSNYRIRSLWINAHTYNLSFLFFFSGEGGGGLRGWGGDRRRERGVDFYREIGGAVLGGSLASFY